MNPTLARVPVLALLALQSLGDLSAAAAAPTPQDGGRRGRWRIVEGGPTPLVLWQRDLADALALVAETKKPLLIAVNTDGEPASDNLAAGRYRNPAFAALTTSFVPVIASPDRHTPKDHDEHGRRIECPRFGWVTCGEHIAIEPSLYERYFQGQRVAPRHVGVSAEGEALFDLLLLQDLGEIDAALKTHGAPPADAPAAAGQPAEAAEAAEAAEPPAAARPLAELGRSRAAADRTAVEAAFAAGGQDLRLELVEQAGTGLVPHFEVLRLALYDESAAVRAAAVEALARSATAAGVDLFGRAFALAATDAHRSALCAALDRLPDADDDPVAQRVRTLRGLHGRSAVVVADAWLAALALDPGQPEPAPSTDELDELDRRLDRLQQRARGAAGDEASAARVEIAEATLRYALCTMAGRGDPQFLLEDARGAAQRAVADGGDGADGRALAVDASASYLLLDFERAAESAAAALPALLAGGQASTPLAAETLNVLAQCRTRALYAAIGSGDDWPAAWVTDIDAAYRVLIVHRAGTEQQAAAQLDVLATLQAPESERAALHAAARRFPVSGPIHERMRWLLLREDGPDGLEAAYAAMHPAPEHAAATDWFIGYASLVAAESRVRDGGAGDAGAGDAGDGAARGSYDRAIERFERCAAGEPTFADSAIHYAALALAGRCRLWTAQKQWQAAVDDALAALARRPLSATATDGLEKSPIDSARLLRRALLEASQDELAGHLVTGLAEQGIDLDGGR